MNPMALNQTMFEKMSYNKTHMATLAYHWQGCQVFERWTNTGSARRFYVET